MKLRETFWQWGHPEGCFNADYGNNKVARMTPMEGCLYLGINKTFMVPMELEVNRRQYNKSFETLSEVGWELTVDYEGGIKPEQADPFIADSKEFKNITCVVLDDFVRGKKKLYQKLTPESLWALREHLHENNLAMWMVLYTHEFGVNAEDDEEFKAYIEPFDGIIMWNWKESAYREIPEKWEIFKALTPNQRRLFGCYLYNFGEKCECTGEAVKWQLDFYREKMFAGEAEGVVLHTNAMADLDFEAYDACREWMALHGDDEFPG